MILVDRETEEIIFEPEISTWVAHYDVGANQTVVMLGDTEVITEPGNMNIEMCEEIISQTYIVFPHEYRPEVIINDCALLDDIEYSISEVLEVDIDDVKGKVPVEEIEFIIEKMFEVESEIIHRLAHRMVDDGTIKIEE